MKIFAALVILCAGIAATQAMLSPEDIGKFRGMAEECKTKEGATEDDINSMIAFEFPKTKPAKCLHACMHESLGMIKDGKVDVDRVVAMASKVFKDNEALIKVTKEVTETCASITDPDRCEMAVKAMKCSHDEIDKRGIKITDHIN